jgi:lipopolysaccharide/colanic/teichoic acid biosynthesis glycosyltransferase
MKVQDTFNAKTSSMSGYALIQLSWYSFMKRITDIVISVIGIIITSPVITITALLIMFESKGGWLYKQQRVGQNGSIFVIYKLRTMYINTDEVWTEKDDPRITRIGKLIRRRRIDELPQLINVLRGEMSLIGPRPERPVYEDAIAKELPDFKERLKIKPGITGWAQVNGGYNNSNAEKLKMDLYYIQNKSFLMDIKIMIMTLAIIITARGAR